MKFEIGGGACSSRQYGRNYLFIGERRTPLGGDESPLPRLFHHSVHGDRTVEPRTPPKGRSFPWVSLPLLVIAEQTTLCVACSIACQRYHTPDSPHLRPNKDGLDARGRLKPPKLVKPTVKRGSRGVFVLLGSAVGRGPHMGGR